MVVVVVVGGWWGGVVCVCGEGGGKGTEAHVLSTEKTIKSHRAVPKVLSECVCHGSLPMF